MSKNPWTKMALGTLIVCHCAGMIDLVALPVWIGALVERFHFSAQQSGAVVTLFLAGAFLASLLLAPHFNNLNQRLVATVGFGTEALAFLFASIQSNFVILASLHLIAGLASGSALSMAHGTMGRTVNPHRLFAIAFMFLGLFGIIMLATLPQLLIAYDGPALFHVFGGIMAIAAIVSGLTFKNPGKVADQLKTPFSRAVWFTIFGIGIMTFNQAMVFAYAEVIGKARGFDQQSILTVLIALGTINFILPAPLAAFLQNRVSAPLMTQIGPVVQAILAVGVTTSTVMLFWAPSAAFFVTTEIFTHTFVFGLLARLDPTGRAVAATPAMALIGAALGPFVGGVLAQNFGFDALGIAAVVVGLSSATCFTLAKSAGSALQPAPIAS